MQDTFIHSTCEVSDGAVIGAGTQIWNHSKVREGATVGKNCVIGQGVYIDTGVKLGDCCKIQNGVSIYQGVTFEDGVFCGPGVVFSNDMYPRAVNPDLTLKRSEDWKVVHTTIRRGASIGANATIVCGIVVGAWALIGAGAVVTRSVTAHGLVMGNPGRQRGYACFCGRTVKVGPEGGSCEACGSRFVVMNDGSFAAYEGNTSS